MKDRGSTSYTKYTQPLREGGPAYGGGAGTNCGSLKFETKLVRVQKPALATAKVGDLLEIAFDTKRNLAAYNATGNVVGFIDTVGHTKLSPCIEKGFEYVAKLLNKVGDVKVMPKP
jgi:hypothetical protein